MALGLKTGDRLESIETDKGHYVIMAATGSVCGLKGIIAQPAKPVSIKAMNATIAARAAR